MQEGTVKWFSTEKGYGFIRPTDRSIADVFVHITEVQRAGYKELEPGEPVEFRLETDNNGRSKAKDIVVYQYE